MALRQYYKINNYYPLLLIAFLLPFNFAISIILAISLVLFFALAPVKEGIKLLVKSRWTYLFFAFFLIHAISYFFSNNKQEAATAIEIKLGFLVFPLLLFTQSFNRIDIRKVLRTFAFAMVLCTIFNVCRAFFFLLIKNDSSHLFYSSFSTFMHPSYFAMYAVFSLLIYSLYGINVFKRSGVNTAVVVLFVALLSAGVFMSASKMGLLTLLVSAPILLFYVLYKRRKFVLLAGIILTMLIGGFVLIRSNFAPVQRLRSAFNFAESGKEIDKTTSESNAVRVLIWGEAMKIIKEHPFIGVTPGDANDQLYAAYQKEGMTGALDKHLNAHNQFLQTSIGTGLIGLLLLLALTLGLLVYGIVAKDILTALFGLLIVLNFLVESMLQTQAGTLFFIFFSATLLSNQANVNKRYSKA